MDFLSGSRPQSVKTPIIIPVNKHFFNKDGGQKRTPMQTFIDGLPLYRKCVCEEAEETMAVWYRTYRIE